jgi:hypothetical protein
MFGFGTSEMTVFGVIAVILLTARLPSISRIRSRDGRYLFRFHHRGATMRKHWNKFLWSSKFWALLGVVGLASGLYFQRVAANGSGLWCLGLIFLGAAYLEKRD